MSIAVENNEIVVTRPSDVKEDRSLHGLTRTLISNMVEGVTNGFKKELEINGVGYRASKEGKNLVMILGYSHKVIMPEIEGISIEVPGPNKIIVSGPDKQVVGQFAVSYTHLDVYKRQLPQFSMISLDIHSQFMMVANMFRYM